MTKRECRESAFILLFEASLREDTPEELYRIAEELDEPPLNDRVKSLVEGVLAHMEEIDGIIASYSKTRAVSRIARVNLILLRMAIYELLYCPEVPVNVAVSEAIGISEKYTYQEDTAFINGVLGAYSRSLPPRTQENA